jgi:hypothetical protein
VSSPIQEPLLQISNKLNQLTPNVAKPLVLPVLSPEEGPALRALLAESITVSPQSWMATKVFAPREHHDVIKQQDTINSRYAEGHLRLVVDEGDGAIIFCQKSAIGDFLLACAARHSTEHFEFAGRYLRLERSFEEISKEPCDA